MPTAEAAEESLAQKTILFLMSKYHFEVEDVNFHFLNSTAAAFVKERSNYINVKERVYGFPEEKEPSQQHGVRSSHSLGLSSSRKHGPGEASSSVSAAVTDHLAPLAKRHKQLHQGP